MLSSDWYFTGPPPESFADKNSQAHIKIQLYSGWKWWKEFELDVNHGTIILKLKDLFTYRVALFAILSVVNEEFFFHRLCLLSIYDEDTKKSDNDFIKRFIKIQCENSQCEMFTIEQIHPVAQQTYNWSTIECHWGSSCRIGNNKNTERNFVILRHISFQGQRFVNESQLQTPWKAGLQIRT